LVQPYLGDVVTTNTFIKRYNSTGPFLNLPANNYWILREESILSYLEQRGSKVPKVYIKDTQDQSLTLEFVGKSFHDIFIKSSDSNPKVLIECIRTATTELLKIFDLGVLHLDIAARNITFDSVGGNGVYVLDFAQSLSSNYVLQKPIPLIPQSNFQHPELVDALKEDWANFFQTTQNHIPDLEKKFEVDDKIFTEYWCENIAIQKLHRSLAILSHSLGQFYFEMSESPILSNKDRSFLINLGHNLRYRENSESRFAIEQALQDLLTYLNNLKSIHTENITQIPIVQRHSIASRIDKNDRGVSEKKVGTKHKDEIHQIKAKLNTSIKELNDKSNLYLFKSFSFKDKLTVIFVLVPLLLLIIHIFWLDLIISTLNILLPDLLVYSIFLIGFFVIFLIGVSIFGKKISHTIFLNLSMLILGTQILISSFILLNSNKSLIIWFPSSVIYLITVLLIYKGKN
jgi:hypothetical protein